MDAHHPLASEELPPVCDVNKQDDETENASKRILMMSSKLQANRGGKNGEFSIEMSLVLEFNKTRRNEYQCVLVEGHCISDTVALPRNDSYPGS